MDILISGASVAGPALAYWLRRYGHRPTIVERAASLRGGGYAVDFRGAVHLGVLEQMGLLDEIRRRATNLGDLTYVDAAGKAVALMPSAVFSGDVEILRGDLAQVLFEATCEGTEYLFGDSITSIEQRPDGALVTFERAESRTFDLVVGADGVGSGVRRLVFGDDPAHRRPLGMTGCIFTMPNVLGLDHTGLLYNEPGRAVTIMSAHDNTDAIASLFYAGDRPSFDTREVQQQRRMVADAFAGAGWETPRLLEAMWQAPDFWFDSTEQIHLDRWSDGRVVLLGDAAFAGGPGGNGTGLAVVGARVLAGELHLAGGDHTVAFARYEQLMRPYVAGSQKQAQGGVDFLVPSTQKKIDQRNRFFRMLRFLPIKGLIRHLTARTATALNLPVYPVPTPAH